MPSFSFVHTADLHLDSPFSVLSLDNPELASSLRSATFEAFEKIANICLEKRVDFLLVAGDTFEDNAIERVLIQRVADLLAEFPGPVYVIPGNHDPLVPGSVWEHPAWRSHANLVMGQDLLRFLKEWWITHIQEEDQQYAPYLAASVPS